MDLVLAPVTIEAWFLLALLVGAAVIGFGMGHGTPRQRRWKRARPGNLYRPGATPSHQTSGVPSSHTADQLRAVMNSDYSQKRVLSRTEAKVLAAAESAIGEAGLPWRVMAQVALGEVLDSQSRPGFLAINAKRVDLLVISEDCKPIAAIEYQGSGHHLGSDAFARDAIKKEALRRAGVHFIEIDCNDGPADVRREIGRLAFVVVGGATSRNGSAPKSEAA